MKMIIYCFLIFLLMITNVYGNVCVMKCDSYQVIEDNNMNEIRSVASISKIMTALIVLEHASLNEMVEVDDKSIGIEGSSIYLKKGDVYSVRALLHGLLLRSGNDAAYALAYYISNDNLNDFVKMMNDKAKEIGMYHTQFENPCGLEEPNGNLSTAYDMNLLMCYVSNNDDLMNILKTKIYKSNNIVWSNKNRLLTMNNYVLGGKTGYTENAGRTLVSIGGEINIKYAITTLNYSDDFNYHNSIYNDLLQDYQKYLLIKKGVYYLDTLSFEIDEDIYFLSKDITNEIINIYIENNYLIINSGLLNKKIKLKGA